MYPRTVLIIGHRWMAGFLTEELLRVVGRAGSTGPGSETGTSAYPRDLADQREERVRIQEQHHAPARGNEDRDQAGRRRLPDLPRLPSPSPRSPTPSPCSPSPVARENTRIGTVSRYPMLSSEPGSSTPSNTHSSASTAAVARYHLLHVPQRQQPHDAQARHHERPHRHRRPPPQPPELAHLGLVRRHQHRPGAEEQRNLPDRCNEEEAEVRRTRDGICGHRSMPGAVSSAMPPCQALRRPTG